MGSGAIFILFHERTVQYSTAQYSIVHVSTVQYSTVQYSTVHTLQQTSSVAGCCVPKQGIPENYYHDPRTNHPWPMFPDPKGRGGGGTDFLLGQVRSGL